MLKQATKERIKIFYNFIEDSSKLNNLTLVFSPSLYEFTFIDNDKITKEDIVIYTSSELLYLRAEFTLARSLGNVRKIREVFETEYKKREFKVFSKNSIEDKNYIVELEDLIKKYLKEFDLLKTRASYPAYINTGTYSRFTNSQKRWLDEKYNLVKHDTELYLTFKDENLENHVKLVVTNQPIKLLADYVTPDYKDFLLLLNRNLGDVNNVGLGYVLTKIKYSLPSQLLERHKEMINYGLDALDNLGIFMKERNDAAQRYNRFNDKV